MSMTYHQPNVTDSGLAENIVEYAKKTFIKPSLQYISTEIRDKCCYTLLP